MSGRGRQAAATVAAKVVATTTTTATRASSNAKTKDPLQLHRVVLKESLSSWAIGMCIATPIVAIGQGALLLLDYRMNHGDAPRPTVPSGGVVMVTRSHQGDENSTHHNNSNNKNKYETTNRFLRSTINRFTSLGGDGEDDRFPYFHRHRRQRERVSRGNKEPPLRLLVIGDSLAAGVGMSESSVPALPESIAQALSKANNGRAVYWTCVGTPGHSSSEIIKEIHNLEDMPQPLVSRLSEWQSQRTERARQRVAEAAIKARDWLKRTHHPPDHDRNREESLASEQEGQHSTKKHEDDDDASTSLPQQAMNPVVRWWKRIGSGLDDYISKESVHRRLDNRVRKMVQHNALEPSFVNQYDIAVVLTGLNDLKDSFLPFMMSPERAKELQEAKERREKETGIHETGFKGELLNLVLALKSRMASTTHKQDKTSSPPGRPSNSPSFELGDSTKENKHSQGPLIVFPALPIAPVEMTQIAPLRWFLGPLIRGMDRNKKVFAEMYPDLVVFVDSPGTEVYTDAEAKRGFLWEDISRDRVLLKIHDISFHVRERVEDLMRQHYKSWVVDGDSIADDEDLYLLEADDVLQLSDQFSNNHHPGATMVSPDGIHPNDQGYELWGRWIANAIMQHYEEQSAHAWRNERRRWRGVPE